MYEIKPAAVDLRKPPGKKGHRKYIDVVERAMNKLRVAEAKGDHIEAENYHQIIMDHERHVVKPTHVADARRAMEKLDINESITHPRDPSK